MARPIMLTAHRGLQMALRQGTELGREGDEAAGDRDKERVEIL